MECRGVVTRTESERALVRVARVNCAECRGCGLLVRDREYVMEFSAVNRHGAETGDEVIVKVPSRRVFLSYVAVFGLPVLGMIACYFLGVAAAVLSGSARPQAWGAAAAVVSGLSLLWVGVKLGERVGAEPVILRVVAAAEKIPRENSLVPEAESPVVGKENGRPEGRADGPGTYSPEG